MRKGAKDARMFEIRVAQSGIDGISRRFRTGAANRYQAGYQRAYGIQ
jgi:hypothetical protein